MHKFANRLQTSVRRHSTFCSIKTLLTQGGMESPLKPKRVAPRVVTIEGATQPIPVKAPLRSPTRPKHGQDSVSRVQTLPTSFELPATHLNGSIANAANLSLPVDRHRRHSVMVTSSQTSPQKHRPASYVDKNGAVWGTPMLDRGNCFLNPTNHQGHHRVGKGEQRMLDWLIANRPVSSSPSVTPPSQTPPWEASPLEPDPRSISPQNLAKKGATLRTSMIQTMMGVRGATNELKKAQLVWKAQPTKILVIKKPNDDEVLSCFIEVALHLFETHKDIQLLVQESVYDTEIAHESLDEHRHRIEKWESWSNPWSSTEDIQSIVPDVDLLITLGGDGTLLYAASIFQLMAPPILPFALGSLGFLTPFDFKDYKKHIDACITGSGSVTLRSRLECEIFRRGDSKVKVEDGAVPIWNVLNEVVIDRGPTPYLAKLDVYCDGVPLTCVQGDGLIVATPTGSTAYSVSAGGSIVHPTVPSMLLTPICPHSLSFRPIILPSTVELVVVCKPDGRTGAWVSMDGKNRQELGPGDGIRITTSVWPIPTVNCNDVSADWFESLRKNLNWNIREMQKPSSQLGPDGVTASKV
eukprot:m.88176 g.88176  ORF g.88176 m.88176 type:complete len:581 (-) comp26162_c0_seq1:231-1973(-)